MAGDTRVHRFPGLGLRRGKWDVPPPQGEVYFVLEDSGQTNLYTPDGSKTPLGTGGGAGALQIMAVSASEQIIHPLPSERVIFDEMRDFSAQGWPGTIQARLNLTGHIEAGTGAVRVLMGGTAGQPDGTEIVNLGITGQTDAAFAAAGNSFANPGGTQRIKVTMRAPSFNALFVTGATVTISSTLTAPTAGPTLLLPCYWLDTSTLVGSQGDAIGTLADLTGLGTAATQATGSKKPLLQTGTDGVNSLNALLLDGVDDFLKGTFNAGSTGMTILLVAATANPLTTSAIVFGSGDANGSADAPTPGIRWGIGLGSSGSGAGAGWVGPTGNIGLGDVAGVAINTAFWGTYRYDKTSWGVAGVNTSSHADTSFPSGTFNAHIGLEGTRGGVASFPFKGRFCELVVWPGQVPVAEMAGLSSYAQAKWGAVT